MRMAAWALCGHRVLRPAPPPATLRCIARAGVAKFRGSPACFLILVSACTAPSLPPLPPTPSCPAPCSNPQWESCLNRTLCVDIGAADLTCEWGAPMATMVGPLHEGAAEQLSEEGLSTDDDAPPPAFK